MKMHMEFVTVGKASSDKIHVKYNDKIATFHGEIGIDYFMVLANKIEWYPNKKATINEKIELMTIANKTFLGEKRLYFIADDAIWFDWKGSPLIVIENNIIKSIKISCVCEVLAEVDEFNDISDFCYLKKYCIYRSDCHNCTDDLPHLAADCPRALPGKKRACLTSHQTGSCETHLMSLISFPDNQFHSHQVSL